MVRERARFIEDYDDNIDQARLDLGKLFRIEDYPSKEALHGRFGIRYRIVPVPDADHFMAKLASDDTERVKRDIERQIEERLHDAVGDLYRRLGEAVERVSERLQEGEDGKPLVFRDSMIANIRDLVDVVPRLNIFGDDRLALLCQEVKDRIAQRRSRHAAARPAQFNPNVRRQVKRDADALMQQFRGVFRGRRGRPGGRVMAAPRPQRIRAPRQRLRDGAAAGPALLREPRVAPADPRRHPARRSRATAARSAIRRGGSRTPTPISSRPPSPAWCWPARSSTTPAGASASLSAGSAPPSSSPTACCATRASRSRPRRKRGTGSASSRPTTACPSPIKTTTARTVRRQADAAGEGSDAAGPQPGGSGDDDTGGDDPATADDAPGEGEEAAAPSSDPSGTGEVMDADARDDGDAATGETALDVTDEEQAWDEAMHQALNLAKAQGKAPGAVEETIRDAHRSTLDWRSLLRRYMTDAAARDYSWSLPNRRFIDSGLYLPSIRSEGMGTLAVIIDTSGSVDAQALAAFWSEVREVAAEIEPERVIVLQVDAAVQDEKDYAPGELPERIVVKGRLGTDFRPGFARLAEQGVQPGACLYFTDMDCDRYPEAEPDFPVVWADWSEGVGLPPQPPPWGEHIRIND